MIRLDKADACWTVTIDRPDKANSLTAGMLADLADIAAQAAGSASALVLTGAGKVFSAGADLEAARAGLATDPVWERLSGTLAGLPCVTVAALNGTLAGGAFGMALACDIRIAVPEASFFYPVMARGYLPQPSDPGRLTDLVGPGRARMILLAGERIDAATALDWGLVDEIVPRDAVMARAASLCAAPLAASPDHVAAIKALCVGAGAGAGAGAGTGDRPGASARAPSRADATEA